MTQNDCDFMLRHTSYMDTKHVELYLEHGMLQMPLFDVNDPERTWKTTDSWAEDIEALDEKRAQARGESE